jgi:hypothetical protein
MAAINAQVVVSMSISNLNLNQTVAIICEHTDRVTSRLARTSRQSVVNLSAQGLVWDRMKKFNLHHPVVFAVNPAVTGEGIEHCTIATRTT